MWLHRENEYEWKYIGVWLDLLPEKVCNIVKSLLPDYEPEDIFITCGGFTNPIEMIQASLIIRNSIPAVIDVNDKKQQEMRIASINELERNRREFIEGCQKENSLRFFGLNVFINSTNEFKCLRLMEAIQQEKNANNN